MLLNLLDNAIKYTPEGGIGGADRRAGGRPAQLSVNDTGLGIDARHLPRLFERFYRVDRGPQPGAGGHRAGAVAS